MDATDKLQKDHTSSFNYEKEMEEALSTIFRNLRGIQEIRFKITSSQQDLDTSHEMLHGSCSEKTCIKLHANFSDHPESEEPDPAHKEQSRLNENINVKCKRRLPVIPQTRGISQ